MKNPRRKFNALIHARKAKLLFLTCAAGKRVNVMSPYDL
jgi:hypothetical protein